MLPPCHDLRVFLSTGDFCFTSVRGFGYGEIKIPGASCVFLGMVRGVMACASVCVWFFLVLRFCSFVPVISMSFP